jgi:predicted aspartyl protease
MRIRAARFLTLMLLASADSSSLVAAEQRADIPFKLYEGFAIVVRGSLGSQENLNFLLDTGAVPSAIHQRLARKLNLTGPREDISVVNQSRSVERVDLPGLHIGPFESSSLAAVVVDLTQIENRLGLRLDAVLGLDALGHENFTIDYRVRKIRLGASGVSGEAVPFELRTEAGALYVVVPSEINSQAVRLLLDTGTDGLILFAASLEERMPTRKAAGARQDVNAGGAYAAQRVEIANLRLGGMEWHRRQATVVETSAAALRDFDGLLGPTSLGITRLTLDFRSNTLYLEVNR